MKMTRVFLMVLLFSVAAQAEKIDFNSLINEVDMSDAKAKVLAPDRMARAMKRIPSSEEINVSNETIETQAKVIREDQNQDQK